MRHFIEIACYGRFSQAVGSLSLTNAALSKHIARLERKMGMRLLVPTSRALHLTREGRLLYENLAPSFQNIEEALNQVGSAMAEPVGRVRLSTTAGFEKYCIVPLLPEFLARHRGIDLAISFHDSGLGLTR